MECVDHRLILSHSGFPLDAGFLTHIPDADAGEYSHHVQNLMSYVILPLRIGHQ